VPGSGSFSSTVTWRRGFFRSSAYAVASPTSPPPTTMTRPPFGPISLGDLRQLGRLDLLATWRRLTAAQDDHPEVRACAEARVSTEDARRRGPRGAIPYVPLVSPFCPGHAGHRSLSRELGSRERKGRRSRIRFRIRPYYPARRRPHKSSCGPGRLRCSTRTSMPIPISAQANLPPNQHRGSRFAVFGGPFYRASGSGKDARSSVRDAGIPGVSANPTPRTIGVISENSRMFLTRDTENGSL
jgi:hypothetical protein